MSDNDRSNFPSQQQRRNSPVRVSASKIPEGPSGASASGLRNRYLFLEGAKAQIAVRSLPAPGKETIIRPFPEYDRQNDLIVPYRVQSLDDPQCWDLSYWIAVYDMAWKLGKDSVSFVVAPTGTAYDANQTPLEVLNKAVRTYLLDVRKGERSPTEHPSFPFLFEQGPNSNKLLSGTKRVLMIQGIMPVANSEWTYKLQPKVQPPLGQSPSWPCLMMIPRGGIWERSHDDEFGQAFNTGKKLLSMLEAKRPDPGRCRPNDFEKLYLHGDPVDPEKGKWLRFRKAGSPRFGDQTASAVGGAGGKVGWRAAQQQQQQQSNRPQRDSAPSGGSFEGYDVEITDEPLPDGSVPSLASPEDLDNIKRQWLDLDQTLKLPDFFEQAMFLNEIYEPELIVFAFENWRREWVSDETWDKFKGAKTVAPAVKNPSAVFGRGQQEAQPTARPQPQRPLPMGRAAPLPPVGYEESDSPEVSYYEDRHGASYNRANTQNEGVSDRGRKVSFPPAENEEQEEDDSLYDTEPSSADNEEGGSASLNDEERTVFRSSQSGKNTDTHVVSSAPLLPDEDEEESAPAPKQTAQRAPQSSARSAADIAKLVAEKRKLQQKSSGNKK